MACSEHVSAAPATRHCRDGPQAVGSGRWRLRLGLVLLQCSP
jgi:hypothetical protein